MTYQSLWDATKTFQEESSWLPQETIDVSNNFTSKSVEKEQRSPKLVKEGNNKDQSADLKKSVSTNNYGHLLCAGNYANSHNPSYFESI